MNIKIRRIVYLLFFLIFFVSSTIVVLFATGYKYNWSKKTLERTGVFFIKSYPKNATVYLNNTRYKKETPVLINRLLPNYYQIQVTKEGYFSWQKNLPIHPQTTTFVEDISLFKNNLAAELIDQKNFTSHLQSPNKIYSVLLEQKENSTSLWFFNILNEKILELYNFPSVEPLELISWSNNNQKILIKQRQNYFIFNINQGDSFYSLATISQVPFEELFWDTYNDNVLYGIYQQKLYQIDLLNKKLQPLIEESVRAAINFKMDVLAVVKENEKYLLKFIKNDKEPILSLPISDNYKLNNPGFGYLTIFDGDQQALYLIEPENNNQPVKTVIKNITNLIWHDDQFLYWNNNELWVYYPDVNQKVLIERTSQPVINAFWHPNVVYLYGQATNQLKVYELDNRDQRNIYPLFNFDPTNINLVFTNKKGDYLYLITTIEGRSGLYKLNIQ